MCVCARGRVCVRVGRGLADFKTRARATATGSARSCAGVSSASAKSPHRRPGRFAQRPPHVDWEDLLLHWAALVSLWQDFHFHWVAYLQLRHLASSRIAKASRVRNRNGYKCRCVAQGGDVIIEAIA